MMRIPFRVLFLVAALAAAPAPANAAEASFRDGLHAFNVRDFSKAFAIWHRLADREDTQSQSSLGYMYYTGQGVAQDSRLAAEWFYRAANRGEPTAQLFLAVMHLRGDGVKQSPELSLMWCELAMTGGQPDSFELRGHIMEETTEAQRREAWRLVAEWYKTFERTKDAR